jgi:excinuclease ABC subunit B
MYADNGQHAKKTIDETNYRRTKQINFNTANKQTPQALNKKIESAFIKNPLVEYELGLTLNTAAEPETEYLSKPELEKIIRENENQWKKLQKT